MRELHHITLKKDNSNQKWGFGLTGGKDVSLTFRIEKVAPQSPAGNAGLKNQDYLVKINGREVFDMNHNDLVKMVRDWKEETLELEIERGEVVVPSFDMMFPKPKEDKAGEAAAYYSEAMKKGLDGAYEIPCMFTACGKPRMKTGKYNVPVGLYSDETLLELASTGGNHGFVDPDKLAPDACPAAKNRKRFDPTKSSALSVLLAQERGDFTPMGGPRM